MEGRVQRSDDFAAAFESAFGRLQVLLESTCASELPWPEQAAVAIGGALEFAASDPAAARVLTSEALAQGVDGVERYERLMTYTAGLLEGGRAASPYGADLPRTTERALVGGVATIIANQVDRGREDGLPRLLPEVLQFVLTPYLGTGEAKRLSEAGDWPGSQPDR